MKHPITFVSIVVSLLALCPTGGLATEAALGRYTVGLFAVPGAGIVPPSPNVYWQSSSFVYSGSAAAGLEIPIGGTAQFGISAEVIATAMTGLWVPDIKLGDNLTFAISGTIPAGYMKVDAALGPLGASDHVTDIGDIMVAPTIGWNEGANFISAALRIYAPTGGWEKNALANIGLNYWTFSPTLSYTHLVPQQGIDFTVVAGLDINTENTTTDYTSGLLAHVDAVLSKKFENNVGIGIFASALLQLTKDQGGPLVDRLDGFEGRSFAIGPVLTYTGGTKEKPVNFSVNWAPEFGVKNRLEGNAVYLNIAGSF
ncbi:transporter [Kaistia defluvii]|uniref:SphA family protein n=1 Tax=Kaistia defluvii TaxID=410841 RepID=UPI00224F92A4|nr:transporter [Kaistia defluvii]MCX5517452.1 transporter [Kaistia defluvii]